jgi:hypothetical protein
MINAGMVKQCWSNEEEAISLPKNNSGRRLALGVLKELLEAFPYI